MGRLQPDFSAIAERSARADAKSASFPPSARTIGTSGFKRKRSVRGASFRGVGRRGGIVIEARFYRA
jgi:hypothetical protein